MDVRDNRVTDVRALTCARIAESQGDQCYREQTVAQYTHSDGPIHRQAVFNMC
jgi:hypothetical protein